MESEMTHNFSFDLPKNKSNVIKVIGVGGGGSNAIEYMFQQGINGVDFVVTNTDAQALNESSVPIKIQLGATLTEGLGAGANPDVGAMAAQESFEDIKNLLMTQTKMVFITAGMGGGTGTGAAPIIANMAKEMDILTVGIVTMPFQFEGKLRVEQAEKGLENIRKSVDALIVINNNKLREVYGNLGFKAGFSKADEVLSTAARGIAEVITHHYRQNIDLKDAKTVLKDSGTAIMGSGNASGTNRAQEAIVNALDSPLLNDNKIFGCKNVLLLIVSGSEEITIDEIGEINDFIQNEAGNNANIIMGIGEDTKIGNAIAVTIIATGFGADQQHQIVNTEAKKIIHSLEEDQTLEQDLMGDSSSETVYELNDPEEEKSRPTEPTEQTSVSDSLEEEITSSNAQELFSIPVISETVVPEPLGVETENQDEMTPEEINNMEVVYELLAHEDPSEMEKPVEAVEATSSEAEEDNFIINDLDEETLGLEIVEMEQVQAEEENQFMFDFSLPIDDAEQGSEDKVVHELENEVDQSTPSNTEELLEEAVTFKFEVVQTDEETPISKQTESTTDSADDSPFDRTIRETVGKENEKRKEHLKKFNHAFKHSAHKIDEFEKQPAYKRMGMDIESSTPKTTSNNSGMTLESDENDEIQLRSNNSFLHDNVD